MNVKDAIGLLLTALALAGCVSGSGRPPVGAQESGALVTTDLGQLRGEARGSQLRFLAIPFAAPPVGDLRWAAPAPAQPWQGVRDATRPTAGCIQAPLPITPDAVYSEDCLYLNVHAPSTGGRKPLPVMVWLHGGGFYSGSADLYDAGRLAEAGEVIVVTVNYRLGVMGFFGYPGLAGSGEFGLQDQQAALRWVRRNAAAFGGDPNNVTLFGESAGSMSVCAQLVSPGASGLFHKAILQSGSCIASWPPRMAWPNAPAFRQFIPVAESRRMGVEAASKVGCGADDIACLRALPPEHLMRVWTTALPAFGGAVLPEDPARALRAGRSAAVPVIWGTTRDEWRSAAGVRAKMGPFTAQHQAEILQAAFGDRATEVSSRYPTQPGEPPVLVWAAIATDVAWSCPTLESVRLAGARAPAYHYEFADPAGPNPGGAYDISPDFPLGAAHATELSYLFEVAGKPAALDPAQAGLARTMIGYWSTFAHTSDPNRPGLPPWRPVSGEGDRGALILDPASVAMVDFHARHQCDFWETFRSAE